MVDAGVNSAQSYLSAIETDKIIISRNNAKINIKIGGGTKRVALSQLKPFSYEGFSWDKGGGTRPWDEGWDETTLLVPPKTL